ncbi:MAG: VCBS repeat-containing protein [Alphaproteobacteria bacterium]|nr:VCBS repeat-containing protein [Alphaproteobacteria bacterium]
MSDIAFSFVDNDEGLTIKTKFSNGDGSYNSHEEFMGDGAGIWDDNVPLVADYNDDGVSDIAFVFSDADVGLQIRTKISNGDGGYSSSEQILGDAQEVWNNGGATVGDFNNDGKSDIVLVFDDINDGLTITTNQASNESKDILDGGSGHDQIYGGSDEDVILGGDGSDLISGGDGDDDIHGGSGVDYLIGETGADTFHFHNLEESSINALDVIADFDENNDKIDLSDLNIEYADLKFTINGEYTDITIENSDFAFRLLGNDHELTEQQFTV